MEIWKKIKGYESLYEVSNHGRVKSLPKKKIQIRKDLTKPVVSLMKSKILKPYLDTSGYYQVKLYKDNKQRAFLVHRLVSIAFIINKYNKNFINHKNGKTTDNRVENLEWVTRSENHIHATYILKKVIGNKKKKVIRNDGKIYESIGSAARDINTGGIRIIECCKGKAKTTKGYSFKYL